MTTITEHQITGLADGRVRVAARINLAGRQYKVSFIVKGSPVHPGIEPFLTLALLPSMTISEPIKLDKPVSPRLLKNLETIQAIFQNWDKQFHKIPIIPAIPKPGLLPGLKAAFKLSGKAAGFSGNPANQFLNKSLENPVKLFQAGLRPADKRKVACLFSGGLNSFYTLLKHQSEIDSLVFVSAGFDLYPHPNNLELRRMITGRLCEAARQMGKEFIEVEANLQNFSDNYVEWSYYHGAAMAALAQLLSNRFHKIYFASSSTYDELIAWGTHPILDNLWSTEKIEIIHDGSEFTRSRKIKAIASSEIALNNLRVCLNYDQNRAYNCGRCEKCIRTMVSLRGEGVLNRCPVFARPLDLSRLPTLPLPEYLIQQWKDTLDTIIESGTDPELEEAVRQCVANALKGWRQNKLSNLATKLTDQELLIKNDGDWARSLEESNVLLGQQLQAAQNWGHSLENELHKKPSNISQR